MDLKKLQPYFLFLVGLAAGLYFISLNVTGYSFGYFPGDLIDGRFNNYLLEHAHRFFTGKEHSFWNAPFLFPEKDVITYSDNLLGTAPFYSVFRLFGAGRETAFQLWYLLVVVLNYSACYILLHYLFKNSYAAVCGALVFAFSMALHSQMGHAQTFPRFAIPLAIWMLLRYGRELDPKCFFWALFFLAYQLYCGIYLGFLLAVPFFILVAVLISKKWSDVKARFKEKKWLLKMTAAALVNLLLLLPLLVPYLERARQTGFYPYENILGSIPTIGSYFFSWRGSLFWDSLSETCISYPAFWDHEIFAGAFATAGFFSVALVFLITLLNKKLRSRMGILPELKAVIVTGIITFVVFLKVNDLSLYRIIYAVPGFGSMRALQRIINVELVFFAAALAYLVNAVTKKGNALSFVLTLVLMTGIIADNYLHKGFAHQREKALSQQRVNALYEKMKDLPEGSIVSYEPDTLESAPMDYQLDAMLAAQSLGLVTLNGYSATSPGGYGPYWVNPNPETRRAWLESKGLFDLKVTVIK